MRKINIGGQGFEDIRVHNDFYVDKTEFIQEWWEGRDQVTLITRPRRFGKTLNMDMLNCFFSNAYAGRSDLFEGLDIWKEEKYRKLQGTYPVIYISFADVKEKTYQEARKSIIMTLQAVSARFSDLYRKDKEINKSTTYAFTDLTLETSDAVVSKSLQQLCAYLEKQYKRKVLILLDEYDTPLQEAYVNGYWDEMSSFMRSLFNSTFKTNPSLERAVLTGITRVSKESIFSDLNNLKVVTTTSRQYETAFGFTQKEVDDALEEYHLSNQREEVKKWYDGFTFGNTANIYNPWSIINFLDNNGRLEPYWANTSSNSLIGHELQHADNTIKSEMEDLLNGDSIQSIIDEQIIFSQLETSSEAIWSLFLASGYLKVVSNEFNGSDYVYTLALTNFEVWLTFRDLITYWFGKSRDSLTEFMKALAAGKSESVQEELENVLMNSVSFYDTESHVTEDQKPEAFYHGLVLGMIVQESKYRITSNRESGYGRYDIMMMPKEKNLPGIIIEFKIYDPKKEKNLEETADRALKQIKEKNYDAELISNGITNIMHYGMGFRAKYVIVHDFESH